MVYDIQVPERPRDQPNIKTRVFPFPKKLRIVAAAKDQSKSGARCCNVGSIPTHLHASIRLTLRYLLANSLDKLYRLGLLCSMFAGREGFEPVMPARPGSLSARGLRFNCHLAENN
jgi:hypothetical protein